MGTWFGHDRHTPGDPTVTPIGNAGPVKDSAKGQPAARLAPHWDPNLLITGMCGTAADDERLVLFAVRYSFGYMSQNVKPVGRASRAKTLCLGSALTCRRRLPG